MLVLYQSYHVSYFATMFALSQGFDLTIAGELEDEDDVIDDEGSTYLEKLEKSVGLSCWMIFFVFHYVLRHCEAVFFVFLQANGDISDDDDEDELDEIEETALESYETPLDKEDCPVDEYAIFKSLLQSELFVFVIF